MRAWEWGRVEDRWNAHDVGFRGGECTTSSELRHPNPASFRGESSARLLVGSPAICSTTAVASLQFSHSLFLNSNSFFYQQIRCIHTYIERETFFFEVSAAIFASELRNVFFSELVERFVKRWPENRFFRWHGVRFRPRIDRLHSAVEFQRSVISIDSLLVNMFQLWGFFRRESVDLGGGRGVLFEAFSPIGATSLQPPDAT